VPDRSPSLIDAVEAAARSVGDMAMRRFRGEGGAYKVWDKSPGNPVSDIDLAADLALRDQLARLDPQAGWLSEETADEPSRLAKRRIWCVDPIDGTRDFVRGRSGWAVSIALVEDGAPVIGVLYAPAREEMWRAATGEGATCNGVRLTAADCRALAGARVPADHLAKEDADLTMIAKPNSIALRIAMVAAGDADLVATLRWGYEWDVAAAALIAGEAGAEVTDAFGVALRFNKRDPRAFGVLASAPGIHRDAVERLAARAARIAPQG
jgi:myo-inositol-1(or 4)-monophosphatase